MERNRFIDDNYMPDRLRNKCSKKNQIDKNITSSGVICTCTIQYDKEWYQ